VHILLVQFKTCSLLLSTGNIRTFKHIQAFHYSKCTSEIYAIVQFKTSKMAINTGGVLLYRCNPAMMHIYDPLKICALCIIRTCERTLLETLKVKLNKLQKKKIYDLYFLLFLSSIEICSSVLPHSKTSPLFIRASTASTSIHDSDRSALTTSLIRVFSVTSRPRTLPRLVAHLRFMTASPPCALM